MEQADQKGSSIVAFFDRLIVETINPTTILLDWAPCHQSMALNGYKIRCNMKNDSLYSEIFVPLGITSYTITGLKPSTDYEVCIDAVDQCQRVICSCGSVTQRTDPLVKEKKRHAVPYIAAITATCLLIAAAMVPVTLFLFKYV